MCVKLTSLLILQGETLGKLWLTVFITAVPTQTMALYGFLSNLISKRENAPQAIGLGIGASIGLLTAYKWCSTAQKVEECVRRDVQEILHLFRPHLHSHEVQVEVNTFLQTISMNAPVISLLGFADVNRQLFTSFVATLVTYLIVLLQFDIGQLASAGDWNVTRSK